MGLRDRTKEGAKKVEEIREARRRKKQAKAEEYADNKMRILKERGLYISEEDYISARDSLLSKIEENREIYEQAKKRKDKNLMKAILSDSQEILKQLAKIIGMAEVSGTLPKEDAWEFRNAMKLLAKDKEKD